MKEESVEVALRESPQGLSVGFSRQDFDHMKGQLALLKEFISSQLIADTDFGIIPGAKKPSLYKSGAEKLQRLFKLGVQYIQTERIFDLKENFALYAYKAQVHPLSNPTSIISECEGSCNSRERKYLSRPATDMVNTIQKMAQKRAFVGAIISATGASDYFTQDVEDMDLPHAKALTLDVADKQAMKQSPGDYVVAIGKKYKGQKLKDIPASDLKSFYDWLANSALEKNEPLRGAAAEFHEMAALYFEELKSTSKTMMTQSKEIDFAEGDTSEFPWDKKST